MNGRKIAVAVLAVIFAILAPSLVFAEPNGREIIDNVYNRPTGKDVRSKMTMTLVNSRGATRERVIDQYLKDYGETEKMVMFFLSPADVRDTSFMNWSYDDGRDEDQWIYLPALKRVKRISSDSKGDYFMGSDFTYDDLGDRHPSEDEHRLLRMESIGNDTVYVVESIPREDDYLYSRTVTWVVKDKWIGLKKEFYDEDGDLLKTLDIRNVEKISGYWVLTDLEMHNVQENHTTNIILSDVRLDSGVSDDMFSERRMRR